MLGREAFVVVCMPVKELQKRQNGNGWPKIFYLCLVLAQLVHSLEIHSLQSVTEISIDLDIFYTKGVQCKCSLKDLTWVANKR